MKIAMKKLTAWLLTLAMCITMAPGLTLTAAAKEGDPCTLEVYISPGQEAGNVRWTNANGSHYIGESVTFEATANDGWTFVAWVNYETEEIHYENSFTDVLEGDTEWTARFRKNGEYLINVNKPMGLEVLPYPNSGSYAPGTKITLTAPEMTGRSVVYEIGKDVDGWAGSVTWERLDGNTFTMQNSDVWVRALYSINMTLTCNEHGTASFDPEGPWYEGDTVKLIMNPEEGYYVKGFSGTTTAVQDGNTLTFKLDSMPDRPVSVEFAKHATAKVNLYVSPKSGGKATLTTEGSVVTAKAEPSNGYHFLCWMDVDNNAKLSDESIYTFKPTRDMNICAIFYINAFISPGIENGTLEIVDPKQIYKEGDTVTLSAHPDDGYVVDHYMAGEYHNGTVSYERLSGNSFVMPAWDMVASVKFVRGCIINAEASPAGGGSVTGAGTYKSEESVTLTASPAEGYTFTGWEENGTVVSTDAEYSFTAESDRNLTAKFQSYSGMSFTISAAASPSRGGTITGTGSYQGGDTVTLTAAPAAGYTFLNWSENGEVVSTDATYSFTANANRTLSANFRSDAGVLYLDANGDSQTCTNYATLSSGTTALNSGWYAVAGNVTIKKRLGISGNVNLILCDGAMLTIDKGVHLTGSNALTIYGQSNGTGSLVIKNPDENNAGIGGNELEPGGVFTMNGGTLTVTGGKSAAGIGGGGDSHATAGTAGTNTGMNTRGWAGTIMINGGKVTVTGGECGAGIGCGQRGNGGSILINGGTVDATGGFDGAAIGGGQGSLGYNQSIENIHISGGDVTANGGHYAAGIGGGRWGRIGSVTIDGGLIHANGGENGAGIGCGHFGADGLITIDDGNVTANGGVFGAGIGGGVCVYGTVKITGGTVNANGGRNAAGIGGGRNQDGYSYTGKAVTISGGKVTANGGESGAGIGGGKSGPGGTVTITGGDNMIKGGACAAGIGGGQNAAGGTTRILGGTSRIEAGLWDDFSLYAQYIGHGDGNSDSGTLILDEEKTHLKVGNKASWASAGDRYSYAGGHGSTLIIMPCVQHSYDRNGVCTYCGDSGGRALQYFSYVNAAGQTQRDADCQPLTSSDVHWNSSTNCSGWYAVTENLTISSRITVNGNVNLILCDGVTLTAPKGIEVSDGNSLTIWRQAGATGVLYAGTINGNDATCDSGDAGIGGGNEKNGGTITINGGMINTTGGELATGIGGGNKGNGGIITINGGTIKARAGRDAQILGRGSGGSQEGRLVITGMRVTEPSGILEAGIESACRDIGKSVTLTVCTDHEIENGICKLCGKGWFDVTVTNGTGSGNYVTGTDVKIKADDPDENMQFKEWTGTDGLIFTSGDKTSSEATFTMPRNAVTLTATYECPINTVTVYSGIGSGNYSAGSSVTVKANESEQGFPFKEWIGVDGLTVISGNANSPELTFKMPKKAVTLTATYGLCAVTVNNGTGGGDFAAGSSVKITANPPEKGKRFKEWTGTDGLTFISGSSTTAEAVFTMPARAVDLTATYEDLPTFLVSVSIGTGGGKYAVGESVTITADPKVMEEFYEWEGADGLIFTSGSFVSSTATFIMPDRDVWLTAKYHIGMEEPACIVYNGSGTGRYLSGAVVSVKADSPAEGKRFKEWTGTEGLVFIDGNVTTEEILFWMPGHDITLTATYIDIQPPPSTYSLTVMSGTGTGYYTEGERVTITASSPGEIEEFKRWNGTDGLTFTSGSATTATATIIMPARNVTLQATYGRTLFLRNCTVNNGTGSGKYEEHEKVRIKADPPEDGKRFKEWTGIEGLVFTEGDATTAEAVFRMPDNDVTLTATYEDETVVEPPTTKYTVTVTNGTGGGEFAEGAEVTVNAKEPETGKEFKNWTAEGISLTDVQKIAASLTFTMPANAVTLTATYEDKSEQTQGGGNGNGGNSGGGSTGNGGSSGGHRGGGGSSGGSGGGGNTPGTVDQNPAEEQPQVTEPTTIGEDNTPLSGAHSFEDVAPGAFYAEPVAWAIENHITNGLGGNKFGPAEKCNRGQVLTFIYRAMGSPAVNTDGLNFTDVDSDAYYRDAVAWAVGMGITSGTSETTFDPEGTCTRAQIVTLLWRAAGSPKVESTVAFSDVTPDMYCYDAVAWAVSLGVTQGTSDTSFSPDETCDRGQVVTFLYRYVKTKA